jgi:DNA-binding SARP family transcriptional activator/tetratricopeptide (TPR) repeat protein
VQALEVSLFGGFQLRRGDEAVPPMPSRAARSLLAYLAVHRGIRQPRDRLVELLWPDQPGNRGRRRLSHTLWQIQDALSELDGQLELLTVSPEAIVIDPAVPCRVDVERFEAGLDQAKRRRGAQEARLRDLTDLESTVALYRGEFLAGHDDAWVRAEQERLHQRYLEALGWLVGLAKAHTAYDDALVYARRLTNEDPLREDAHREVMRLSVLLGRTSDAIRQFERVREVLAEEMGAQPSAETAELHQRIVRQRELAPATPEPTPFPERVPLMGRDRDRDVAVTALERALGGRGSALFVEGEPGVGVSRLLAEVVDDAHWRGFGTVLASCRRPEAAVAYGVIQDLLDDVLTPLRVEQLKPRVGNVLLAEAAKLVPVLGRAVMQTPPAATGLTSAEGAQRMRDALGRILLALASIDPLVLVVDDAQWADLESLQVLRSLGDELGDTRLVVIIGYRGEEARSRETTWSVLRDLDRAVRPERLLLHPLDPFSSGELLRVLARGHSIAPGAVARLQRETGGNPRFLVETLRSLTEDELLGVLADDGATELPMPGSIREVLLGRIERIAPEPRAVLELGAVAGDGIDLDTLATAAELPREAVVDAVDALVRRGLFEPTGDAFVVHHHQLERAVVEALDPEVRRATHHRLAVALQRLHPDAVEQLGYHFAEAGVAQVAVGYLRQAGRAAAAVHAYPTAAAHYRRAVEQLGRAPVSVSTRAEVLAEHETVLDVLGDREGQRRALEELAILADGVLEREVEVARRRALLSAHLGDLAVGLESAERAVAGAEQLRAPDPLARALVAQASVLSWSGRRADAVPVLERVVGVGAASDVEVQARVQLGSVLRELQRYEEAVSALERVLALADREGEAREEIKALVVLGSIRMETGQADAASDLYSRAIDRSVEIGFRQGEALGHLNRANARYVSADIRAAIDDYDVAERLALSLQDRRLEGIVRSNQAAVLHGVLGDDHAATLQAERALTYFEEIGDAVFAAQCRDTLAGVRLREGDLVRARQHLAAASEAAGGAGHDVWMRAQLARRASELAIASGDLGGAAAELRSILEEVGAAGLVDVETSLQGCLGEVLARAGDGHAACAATRAAIADLHSGVERPYLVRLQHALALRAAGYEDEADAAAAVAAEELRATLAEFLPHERERALAIPEHERIVNWVPRADEGRHRLVVASADAPVGRALTGGEMIEVVVDRALRHDDPADPVERRRAILHRVVTQIEEQRGAPTVHDLATVLDVSSATVRRDIAALRDAGRHVATRGRRSG